MKISKNIFSLENSIILALIGYLAFRIFSDFIYLDEKPMYIQLLFTLTSILLIAYNYAKLINKTDIVIFIIASLIAFYPLLFTQEVAEKQLLYNIRVLLTPLVILSCYHLDISFEKLRALAQLTLPIIIIISFTYLLASFGLSFSELYGLFDNNPLHTNSQIIAKVSLLFIHSKHFFLFLFLTFLIFLNVRSNIVPILAIALFKSLRRHFIYIALGGLLLISLFLIVSAVNPDTISFDSILERFISKNRADNYAGEGLQKISSGRTEIWAFYFNYISENFTLINYIFGTGSLQMQGKYPLNAHNDFLNIIVDFGAFGLFSLGLIYYEIYRRLDYRYRNYIAIYFIFVFLVNGIMFHQSNIIFLLYLRGKSNKNYSSIRNTNNKFSHDIGYANSFAKGQ